MPRPEARKSTMSLCVAALLCVEVAAQAQQPTSAGNTTSRTAPHKSHRQRSKVSRPADFTGAGLLQFECGYDGDFRSRDANKDQTGTTTVLFNATENAQLELDFDAVHSYTTNSSHGATGVGDLYLSAQVTVFQEAQRRTSLGVAYVVTLPTAGNGLGTGRIDHKLKVLSSKKLRGIDVDVNASLLVNGNPDTRERDMGYQFALGFSRDLSRRISLQADLFGETLDTDQPRGLFVQGGIGYQPGARAVFDVGVRAGLTPDAPRVGLFAGVSFDLADLYER